MNGKELYDRFIKTLDFKGMTKKDFCEKTGVKQTALSNWGTRGTMPSADLTIAIAKGLDVSIDYVLGISDIPNPEIKCDYIDDELELIETFRSLNDETKRQLIMMLAFLKDQENKKQ